MRRRPPRPGPAAPTSEPEAPEPPLTPRAALRWGEPFLIPILVLLLARVVYAYFLPVAAEDAYITFRYARSFASGHGLVFNPGQHVMGFTSPLWTMWMSLGFLFHADPVPWSRVTSIACDLVTLLTVTIWLRRTVSRASAWCFALFFALWPYFSAMTASGMESSLMLMLMALSAVLVERRHVLAPLALAALACSRPEGVLAAAVLALRAPRRQIVMALALVVIAALPLALYFGSIVPQSVFAKSRIYGTPGPWAGRAWWMWLVPRPYDRTARTVESAHLVSLAVLFLPALIVGVRSLWARRNGAIARLFAASTAIWLGYSLSGVAYFYWYLLVPLAGLSIAAAVGLPQLIRGRLLYASLLLYLAGVCADGLPIYFTRLNVEYTGFAGAAGYLQRNARPGEKVFLEPIGIIGYSCPLVIVDEIGLVSPEVARRRLQGAGWYADVVARERPEWLVTRRSLLASGEAWAGTGAPFRDAAERRAMLERYAVVDTIEKGRVDLALLILRRR